MNILKNHQLRLAFRWLWRLLWLGALLVLLVWVFEKRIATWFGGRWEHRPEEISQLSPESQALLAQSLGELRRGKLYDYGVHMLPVASDQALLPGWQTPLARIEARAWRSAAAVPQESDSVTAYYNRLLRLQRSHPLLPVMVVHANVARDRAVSLQAVADGQRQYPGAVLVSASVDPLAENILELLTEQRKAGVKHIYLDAAALGIERFDEPYANFIRGIVNNGMTLVVQGSPKRSDMHHYPVAFANHLDPEALQPLLKRGARVIFAGATSSFWPQPNKRRQSTVEKLVSLVERYPDNLYVDIGSLPYTSLTTLEAVLQSVSLHDNLVYSSQYPAPGFASLLKLDELVDAGFISEAQATALRELYHYNPMLMDYVLKSQLALPHTQGADRVRFPLKTFMAIDQRPRPEPEEPSKDDK